MKSFLVYTIPALVGFVVGYFFALPILVLVTVVSAIVAIITRPRKEMGLAAVAGMIVWINIAISNVTLWATYLSVTHTDLRLGNLSQYILRQ